MGNNRELDGEIVVATTLKYICNPTTCSYLYDMVITRCSEIRIKEP